MASLLANKPMEDWPVVYKSIGLGHGGNDDVDNTRNILSLSYYDLSLHLKPCLLDLSIFPEDYYIEKNMLIWKWITEGFVHEEKAAGIGLFELGEGYFNELINRSLILPAEAEDKGYIDGCHVHDMVLDLVRLLSAEENFVTVLDGSEELVLLSRNSRRLALQCSHVIRVLALQNCLILDHCSKHSLQHVWSLLHLRYLGLQYIDSIELPEDVGHLKFLQVLDLLGTQIKELPESMGLLTKLVCLRANRIYKVSAGLIGELTSLEEIWIEAENDDRIQFMKALGKLSKLRVLWIRLSTYEPDERPNRDLLDCLHNLHSIQTVDIYASSGKKSVMWEEGHASPQCLRHLCLQTLKFCRFPMWLNSSFLPNLCYLELQVMALKEQDMETLGRLPELNYLKLDSNYTATISTGGTSGDVYFQKLRIFKAPRSLVWFDLHNIICNEKDIMPSLESLKFTVHVQFLKDANLLCFENQLGFGNLGRTSLQRVEADIYCAGAHTKEVEEAEAALAQAAAVHPNHPTLKIVRIFEDRLLSPYKEPDRNITYKTAFKNVKARVVKDDVGYFDFHWLLHNPNIRKFEVYVDCEDATLEEVEEAEAAAWCAANDHPNRPALEIIRCDEDKMMLFDIHQEKFSVLINYENASLEEVEEAEAAARYAVDVHLNRPTKEIR
uniref:NB-ARC domain-containing protein n=1 Tax=Oryza nivara TaxID=4536 RepID=A0A0E0IGS6_ORYNI